MASACPSGPTCPVSRDGALPPAVADMLKPALGPELSPLRMDLLHFPLDSNSKVPLVFSILGYTDTIPKARRVRWIALRNMLFLHSNGHINVREGIMRFSPYLTLICYLCRFVFSESPFLISASERPPPVSHAAYLHIKPQHVLKSYMYLFFILWTK